MSELSPAIAERARKNVSTILQALASVGQVHAAHEMGVSESTVSRLKGDEVRQVGALLAAVGLKCVPVSVECFDPEYVRALKVMAGVGLKQPEPQALDWTGA